MLALKLLLRTWRGGQLGLIFWSLVLAVAVVSSVALLADRVERALINESSSFLAADLQLRSSKVIDQAVLDRAGQEGVSTAHTALFSSMVYFGEQMHLASVKAVENGYPLRGELKRSVVPFTTNEDEIETLTQGPSPGEVWVDSRLLPLLGMQLGDSLEVGEAVLKVSHILIQEPDRTGTASVFGARVLMNWADLDRSGVVQPGSRVWFRLLIAGDQQPLANYKAWLETQLDSHQRLVTPDEAEQSISSTMDRGRRFLLLSGSIGVILAGVALALASRHFASSQLMQVALLKSWGVSAQRVRRLYVQQSLWLAMAGSLLGLALGYLFHEILIAAVREWLPIMLPAAGWRPWSTGLASGFLCVLGFALPALWHLPAQSPMAVLRADIRVRPIGSLLRLSIGVITVIALLYWYSSSWRMSFSLLAGFALTAALSAVGGLGLLRLGRGYGHWAGSLWRLAYANLWRRRSQSLIQMLGFSGAIALLMIMAVVRTSLVDEWRWQLADDAPNHFLVNVASHQQPSVVELIKQRQLETAGWYSMVRGRIVQLNGAPPDEALKTRHESLNRELNLSWTADLPEDNKLMAGQWWSDLPAAEDDAPVPVSIEYELADELGLTLGDTITFSIGGLQFEAQITSTRSLNWDNMTPNFYFLFPEGVLEDFPRSGMTSLYVPPSEKLLINDILKKYPTITVIELDKIIERIRTIVSQVTRGLELMTLMILGCGVLVMLAAVSLSMTERLEESAVLRTLGSSRRMILGVQLIEFASLGAIAGLLAALGSELAVALLQHFMFDLPVSLHPWLWLIGPLGGGLLVGALGVFYSRKAVRQPPLVLLRALD